MSLSCFHTSSWLTPCLVSHAHFCYSPRIQLTQRTRRGFNRHVCHNALEALTSCSHRVNILELQPPLLPSHVLMHLQYAKRGGGEDKMLDWPLFQWMRQTHLQTSSFIPTNAFYKLNHNKMQTRLVSRLIIRSEIPVHLYQCIVSTEDTRQIPTHITFLAFQPVAPFE